MPKVALFSGPFALEEASVIIIDNDYASGKLEVAEVNTLYQSRTGRK